VGRCFEWTALKRLAVGLCCEQPIILILEVTGQIVESVRDERKTSAPTHHCDLPQTHTTKNFTKSQQPLLCEESCACMLSLFTFFTEMCHKQSFWTESLEKSTGTKHWAMGNRRRFRN
jgi:hypothetical protein